MPVASARLNVSMYACIASFIIFSLLTIEVLAALGMAAMFRQEACPRIVHKDEPMRFSDASDGIAGIGECPRQEAAARGSWRGQGWSHPRTEPVHQDGILPLIRNYSMPATQSASAVARSPA